MKLIISREALLGPLQAVVNVVERRQSLPILSNVLLNVGQHEITFTATDMEVEISATLKCESEDSGLVTLPARKLLDIGDTPRFSAVAQVAVGEQDNRGHVLRGYARCFYRHVKAIAWRRRGQHADRRLSVPAIHGL